MDRIDATDATILRLLQERGRIKRTEIAEAVGVSIPTVSERMRKLEARGVITGYHAVVDARRLGRDITAFVRVRSTGSEHYAAFVDAVGAMDEVLELHSVTGGGSHLLKVRVANTAALEALLGRLQALDGVRGTETSLVLSTLKESRYVHAEPMTLHDVPDA